MALISVIVPVYNVEKYLRRCVDSILAQTFTDFELILVDDGSPDNCGAICDEYAAKDDRVQVIHKENGGVSSARNVGLEVAKGDYIAFVDSDDYIEKDYLACFSEHPSDLTLSAFHIYNERGKVCYERVYEKVSYEKKADIDFVYLCDKLFSPYCKLFRKEIIQSNHITFPLAYSWGEDGVFVSEYIKYADSVHILPSSGYHYISYQSRPSLATSVRADIVDMITLSRETYMENLETVADDRAKEKVTEIITEDIRWNCVYFVKKAFDAKCQRKEKIRLLTRFYANRYVQDTIRERRKYYSKPFSFVIKYTPEKAGRRYSVYRVIYAVRNSISRMMPRFLKNAVKAVYRKMKTGRNV